METPQIIHVESESDRQHAFSIRHTVFVAEQHVSKDIEFDGLDGDCEHFLATLDGQPVGALRLREIGGGIVKIERVAVLRRVRGRQVGVALMKAALEHARARGQDVAKLHAQTHVAGFYARLGFIAYGDVFEEDGIPHVAMRMGLVDEPRVAAE